MMPRSVLLPVSVRGVLRGRLEAPRTGVLHGDHHDHLVGLAPLLDGAADGGDGTGAVDIAKAVVDVVDVGHAADRRQIAGDDEGLGVVRPALVLDLVTLDLQLGDPLDVRAVVVAEIGLGLDQVAAIVVGLDDGVEVLARQGGGEGVAELQREHLLQGGVRKHGVPLELDRFDRPGGVGRPQLEHDPHAPRQRSQRLQLDVAAAPLGEALDVGEQGVVVEQVTGLEA
ncbi:MAG: hypothetical protein P8Z81_15650 [Deinococcales bacterium]